MAIISKHRRARHCSASSSRILRRNQDSPIENAIRRRAGPDATVGGWKERCTRLGGVGSMMVAGFHGWACTGINCELGGNML